MQRNPGDTTLLFQAKKDGTVNFTFFQPSSTTNTKEIYKDLIVNFAIKNILITEEEAINLFSDKEQLMTKIFGARCERVASQNPLQLEGMPDHKELILRDINTTLSARGLNHHIQPLQALVRDYFQKLEANTAPRITEAETDTTMTVYKGPGAS